MTGKGKANGSFYYFFVVLLWLFYQIFRFLHGFSLVAYQFFLDFYMGWLLKATFVVIYTLTAF